MIHFVICTKDGRIDQTGIYDEELLHTLDIPEGGALVVNQSMPAGDFFYFSKGAFHAIPEKPAGHYSFDYSKKAWVDPRSLQDFKDAQWEQVKLQRSNTELSVFKFQGRYYDCDRVSQSRIQGAVQLASIALANNQTVVQEWTTADNSVVSLNATDLLNLGLQLGLFVNKVHDYGRVLRARIDAADSSLDVQEVLWDEAEFNATLQ